jgi:hypothetical protein
MGGGLWVRLPVSAAGRIGAGVAVATRLVGVVGLLVIAAMTTLGLGDLGGLVQRLFVALLFGAPVVPAVS